MARIPHAIPATFFSIKRWFRRVTPIIVGVPLTRASRGPHNPPGYRPLYEYRTGPSFAQAHLTASQPPSRPGCRASPITFVACLTPFPPRPVHLT